MKYCILGAAIFLLLSCNNSESVATPSQVSNVDSFQLTDSLKILEIITGNKREWKLNSTTIWLGDKCDKGEILTFSNNTVRLKTCINGEWQKSEKEWSIKRADKNWKIRIGEQEYNLEFNKSKISKNDMLTLSILPTGKTDIKTTKIYISEK